MDTPIYSPALPYVSHIPGGFGPGRMLRFQGVPHPSGRCFSINLQCGGNCNPRDDVALHLSPVFSPPPRVVRNSLQMGSWGPEESHGSFFPFSPGQSCEILVLAENSRFMVAINGEHFCEFYHRIPVQRITHVAIDGEVTVSMFKFEGTASPQNPYDSQPPYIPQVPTPQQSYQPYPTSQSYVSPVSSMVQQPYVPMPTVGSQPYMPTPTTGQQPYMPMPTGQQAYPVQPSIVYPSAGHGAGGYYPGTSIAYPD